MSATAQHNATADRKVALQAALEAQGSRDPHAEARALRALIYLDYQPDCSRDRPELERFFSRVVMGMSDCWFWYGGLTYLGYGVVGKRIRGERVAHRAAYRLFKGEITPGLHVMHSCDVRCCVNPEHLSLGTHADNMADMARKGRGAATRMPGERNPMARLTRSQVEEIRRLHREGISQHRLARLLDVSHMTISRAVRGETWK